MSGRAASRVVYRETGGVLEVRIPEKKNPWGRVLLPLWLAVWTVFGSGGFTSPAWTLLWAVSEAVGIFTLLWNWFGEEVITVGGGTLAVSHPILGRGKARVFEAAKVRELRAAGFFDTGPGGPVQPVKLLGNLLTFAFIHVPDYGLTQGAVTFRYGNRTFRIGVRLTREEAHELAEKIKPYLRGKSRKRA